MIPSNALWIFATAYSLFMGAAGAVTGVLISLLLRRRPSGRDALIDFVLAVTAGLAVAILLTAYQRLRGISSSGGPSVIPVAIGAVAIRHFLIIRRRPK
jgi:multisubunit Na+/H+ antiporter MnhB subunit